MEIYQYLESIEVGEELFAGITNIRGDFDGEFVVCFPPDIHQVKHVTVLPSVPTEISVTD
jgi:hypothetical protein